MVRWWTLMTRFGRHSLLGATLLLPMLLPTLLAPRSFKPTQTTATRWVNWVRMADAPLLHYEAQGVAVGDKLYVFGGFYDDDLHATRQVDRFDPDTNTWTRLSDMPVALTHSPVTADATTIYLVGGYAGDNPAGSTDAVWAYTIATDSWAVLPALPEPRGAGAATVIDRTLHYYAGAQRPDNSTIADDYGDHWTLDLDQPTGWVVAPTMPEPRNHVGGVTVNGQAYAIGGQLGEFEATLNQIVAQRYDPATSSWTRLADLPVPRSHVAASTLNFNGRLMTLGGSVNGGTGGLASPSALLYAPAENIWLNLPVLPSGVKTPVAGVLADGRVVLCMGTETWLADFNDGWEWQPNMPVALGEVAGGRIGSRLFLVGDGDARTLLYDLYYNTWGLSGAPRPYPGSRHAAEVIDGRLYLFGGLGNGAEGRVQIYNPATDSWSLGAPMPFNAGSSASALINGNVYVAGGIVGGGTTNAVAAYNPTTNTWRSVAAMPAGRNYAAAGTDGYQLFVFGGRTGGSEVSNGYATVQIYDPVTDSWRSSATDSSIAPLPLGRGGVSRAVYLDGRFYVMGGETLDGPDSPYNNIYDQVNIYNVATNVWTAGTVMPTGRHGIFPLEVGGRLYVAGGGTFSGPSTATTMEIYDPPWFSTTASDIIRINAGGPAVTTGGVHWQADSWFGGGKTYASSNGSAIEGTNDDVLYLTERSATTWGGSFSYAIPVPAAGRYQVRLHLAEIYWGAPGGGPANAGARVFDANLEGGPVELAEYDINAAVGPLTAVVKTYEVAVSDGVLNLELSASVDQPKLSAIEVRLLPPRSGPPVALPLPQVAGLRLIDAVQDQPVPGWKLTDGATLDLALLPAQLNIQALIDAEEVGSVKFILDGVTLRVDNQPVYALAGNVGADFLGWTPTLGAHKLIVQAFRGTYGTGEAGPEFGITFDVINSTAPRTRFAVDR